MDDEFILLRNKAPLLPSGGIEQIVKRAQIINAICENDRLYETRYPNVYKLCKVCINDICNHLVYLSNWETRYYKSYNDYLIKNNVDPELKKDIQLASVKAKEKHANYKQLYQQFTAASIKLVTKECVICKETKPKQVD